MATRKPKEPANFQLDYGSVVEEVSKKFKMTGGSMERKSIIESTVPTGMLAVDLILGGGIVGGRWYTSVGGEGAGKTTLKTQIELAAAAHNVPILLDADYEGCFTEDTLITIDGQQVLFSDLLKEFDVIKDTNGGTPVCVQRSKAQLFVDSYAERKVPAKFKYGGHRRTTTLHLANGLKFEGAAHPIMASVIGSSENLWFGWCMLEQIKQGSYVMVKVGTKLPDGSTVQPISTKYRIIGSLRTISGKDYVAVPIVRITKNLQRDVWDVTLTSNAVPLQGAIITNGILTHNSNDPKYCEGMIEFWGGHLKTLEDVFGVIDDKGKVVVPPKVRYMTLDTAEEFFDGAASMLRRLPDKVYVEGKWWYAWDDSKVARQQSKGQHSAVMYSRYKRLMVEAENGTPQGIFFVDSYPMMFPDKLNEDDSGSGMAAVARAMSANVPKVFSKLRKKNFSIVGVNQLRQKPAVMYGCLHHDSIIHFVDGRKLPIGEVVNNKIEGEVWALDEQSDTLVPRKILGWHNNGQAEHWIQITVETDEGERVELSVTPNHKIYTHEYGWIKAENLSLRDLVVMPRENINENCKSYRIDEVTGLSLVKKQDNTKYDITVEGCENYLAGNIGNGIVVHNSPFYEPCGDTLKYASSCRIWLTPRSVPHGKGQIEKEHSVLESGAEDTYRYIHLRTVKNKTFTPYLETWMRIWVDDGSSFAHGFDPVWDTYQFLLETGQLGANSSLKRGLTLPTLLPDLKKPISWIDFKALILLQGKELKEHCAKLGIGTNPKIRERCRKQIEDRSAFTMYFETIASRSGKTDSEEE